MRFPLVSPLVGLLGSLLFASACSTDSGSEVGEKSPEGGTPSVTSDGGDVGGHLDEAGRAALQAKHVDQYLGAASPTSEADAGDYVVYDFDPADGPICLWGDPYHALTRDSGSEDLLIYLQGGGACWTSLCAANETASTTAPTEAILDATSDTNALAGWNVVYAPYCDGSVFAGDNELEAVDAAGTTRTRYHHGLRNLSAVIDIAKEHFPNPRRIVLAGSSAGGYGTLTATALVMLTYPDTDLIVFNDAGLGLSNPDDPSMFQEIESEWKFSQFVPDGCSGCDSGQLTGLIAWGLEHNPSLRAAAFSSYGDAIIGGTFLQTDAATFKSLLLEQTGTVADQYPDRFKRFFIEGTAHTTLILGEGADSLHGYFGPPSDGVTVAEWTRAFVDGSADWVDHLENGGM